MSATAYRTGAGWPADVLFVLVLQKIARQADAVDGSHPLLPTTAGSLNLTARQQSRESRRPVRRGEARRWEPLPCVQFRDPRRIVRLIEPHRHQKLRNTGGQRLSACADAAVMDGDGRPRKQ